MNLRCLPRLSSVVAFVIMVPVVVVLGGLYFMSFIFNGAPLEHDDLTERKYKSIYQQ